MKRTAGASGSPPSITLVTMPPAPSGYLRSSPIGHRLLGRLRTSPKKTKVAPLVRLQHVLLEQLAVAPYVGIGRGTPRTPAPLHLLVGDHHVEPATGHVEAHEVAGADEGERPPDGGFRRHVEDDRPVGGAGHPRVGNPHHVGHAAAEQLLWDRELSPLG